MDFKILVGLFWCPNDRGVWCKYPTLPGYLIKISIIVSTWNVLSNPSCKYKSLYIILYKMYIVNQNQILAVWNNLSFGAFEQFSIFLKINKKNDNNFKYLMKNKCTTSLGPLIFIYKVFIFSYSSFSQSAYSQIEVIQIISNTCHNQKDKTKLR